jgi:hypothetical protein
MISKVKINDLPRRTTMTRICLYLKDTPSNPSKQQVMEINRVPVMGEFIDLGFNLYRVFLVCHTPFNADYQASVAALKTDWNACDNLIDQQESTRIGQLL